MHSPDPRARAYIREEQSEYLQDDVDVLAPLLAGAHARGLADALEMLGMPAVFLDRDGSVLHAASAATSLLGPDVSIMNGQLVGNSQEVNQMLQSVVAEALDGDHMRPRRAVAFGRRGAGSVSLRTLPVPGAASNPVQLLKAVILLAEEPALV